MNNACNMKLKGAITSFALKVTSLMSINIFESEKTLQRVKTIGTASQSLLWSAALSMTL